MRPSLRRLIVRSSAVLVTVVGLAAVAIPSYLNAIQRSIVRRALGAIHALASALEAYRSKHGTFPVLSGRQRAEALSIYLVPEFLTRMPEADVWARPYFVFTTPVHYEVWSFRADGAPGPNFWDGPTDDWNSDILFSDGHFRRYPKGTVAQP